MAVFVGIENETATVDGTVTVNVPAGTADGNFMVAVMNSWNTDTDWPVEAGWTLLHQSPDEDGLNSYAVFTREASSEPASYAFAVPTGVTINQVAIVVYSDANGEIDDWGYLYQGDCPDQTSSADNQIVLRIFTATLSGANVTSPGTELLDEVGVANRAHIAIGEVLQASAGATGTTDWPGEAASEHASWTIVLANEAVAVVNQSQASLRIGLGL